MRGEIWTRALDVSGRLVDQSEVPFPDRLKSMLELGRTLVHVGRTRNKLFEIATAFIAADAVRMHKLACFIAQDV